MKNILLILAACMVAMAYSKTVGPAPLGEASFIDTEASTNMPPPACAGDTHSMAFSLDFIGTPSNAVEGESMNFLVLLFYIAYSGAVDQGPSSLKN